MDENYPNIHDTRPVYETLQKLKDGRLNPIALSREIIYLCVEVLLLDGYQVSSIANLLKKSDRTIYRYVKDLRAKNALEANLGLTQVLLGEFLLNARNQYSRLKQIARTKDIALSEKSKTEFLAWRVYKELIDTMFYVGFLVGADSTYGTNSTKDISSVQKNGEIEESPKLLSPEESKKKVDEVFRQIMKNIEENVNQDCDGGSEKGEPSTGKDAV